MSHIKLYLISKALFQKSSHYKIVWHNFCNLFLTLQSSGCFSEMKQPQCLMWPLNVTSIWNETQTQSLVSLLKEWAILNKSDELMIWWLTHNTVTYRHLHLILQTDSLILTVHLKVLSSQTLGPLGKTTTSIYHKRRTWIWITGFWDLQKKEKETFLSSSICCWKCTIPLTILVDPN